jgi:hypothetical protein
VTDPPTTYALILLVLPLLLGMIDIATESPLSLAQAAKLVPPARNGKRTHLSTLLRWILTGATAPDGSRVRLDAMRLGGRWMTTVGALQRFAAALTPRVGDEAPASARSPTARTRASECAAELTGKGV